MRSSMRFHQNLHWMQACFCLPRGHPDDADYHGKGGEGDHDHSGWSIEGENVEVLDTSVKQVIAQGRPVSLCLGDVSSINESARELLGRLAANAGVYNSYIVEEISASAPRQRSANNPLLEAGVISDNYFFGT